MSKFEETISILITGSSGDSRIVGKELRKFRDQLPYLESLKEVPVSELSSITSAVRDRDSTFVIARLRAIFGQHLEEIILELASLHEYLAKIGALSKISNSEELE